MSSVVILSERKPKPEKKEPTEGELSLAQVAEKNKKNKERVEKERLKDNKSVLRSYRIKK